MFLEAGVAYELNRILSDLRREGRLLPPERLASFQDTFQEQFGPSALSRLDGEELLHRMHGRGTGDSLVYYLEYKNDDTFRTQAFGSISGGSAYNFDLFFSQKRGAWIAGIPTRSREISRVEAIDRARRQRDEVLAAAAALDALPPEADDDAYARLQETLDRQAPTVSGSAWGHKYLSLLFPDKIDPFHVPEYQRHHLIRLLIRPPELFQTRRYVMAGLLSGVARSLGTIPMNHLAETLTVRNGRRPRGYWRIATRDRIGGASLWEIMLRDGCAILGDSAPGELTPLRTRWTRSSERRRALAAGGVEGLVRSPRVGRVSEQELPYEPRRASEFDALMAQVREQDVIAAMDGRDVLGLGYVCGDPIYAEGEAFPQRLPVEWRSLDYWSLPHPPARARAFGPLNRHGENLIEIERRLRGESVPFAYAFAEEDYAARTSLIAEAVPPFYSPSSELLLSPVGETPPTVPAIPLVPAIPPVPVLLPTPPPLSGLIRRIDEALRRKGQVILHGPPGTGKSYWAETAARAIVAHGWHGVPPNEGALRTCCFHPAYGYEDFLEGFRPDNGDRAGDRGALRFERRDGIFKRLCRDAAQFPDRPFLLIVDEINRGDAPRIFGELLNVLEQSKRGARVLLPLSGEAFAVPPNVYLIGTMNTADRSIALLDAALRRRFAFIEMRPDLRLLAPITIDGLPLAPLLAALNARIADRMGHEGRHREIGHAYFLDVQGDPIRDLPTLARVLRDDIVPLLEDYAFDDPALLPSLLGPGLVDSGTGRVRDDLFEPDRADDLLRALRQIFPVEDAA